MVSFFFLLPSWFLTIEWLFGLVLIFMTAVVKWYCDDCKEKVKKSKFNGGGNNGR